MKALASSLAISTNHARKSSSLIALLIVGLVLSSQASAVEYTITDLGTLGGTSSQATGINNSGQVVGYTNLVGDTTNHAFLYSNGAMSDLGTLGGSGSVATGINNNGQVVGYANYTVGNLASHAFLYSNGAMADIGTLGGSYSAAYGINNNGEVVGQSVIRDNYIDNSSSFLYSNGSMTSLGGYGQARGINDNGQVVGWSSAGAVDSPHAFFGGVGLGLGGRASVATAINNSGQVVGYSMTTDYPPTSHAFLYSNSVISDLGTLGGTNSGAYAINNSGQVVGSASNAADNSSHAFLYSGGSLLDLNNQLSSGSGSGWLLSEATGINDLGQIVGNGTINGQTHAYLMTPTPIPAAAWLLGSGLLGLIGVARRKAE